MSTEDRLKVWIKKRGLLNKLYLTSIKMQRGEVHAFWKQNDPKWIDCGVRKRQRNYARQWPKCFQGCHAIERTQLPKEENIIMHTQTNHYDVQAFSSSNNYMTCIIH